MIVHQTDTSGVGHSDAIWDLLACPECHPRAVKAVQDAMIELWNRTAAIADLRWRSPLE